MISVVTVTFKRHRYLRESMESILNQSYKDIEYIIVPVLGDKKDIDIIKSFKDKRIKVIYSNYACITHQRNLGLYAAKGDNFMFFDSDDVMLPNRLRELYKMAQKYNTIILYPSFNIADKHLRVKSFYKACNHSRKKIMEGCYISDVSFLNRKEFMKYAPLRLKDKKFRFYRMWKEMAANKEYDNRIMPFPEAVFNYRRHGKNISKLKSQADFCYVRIGENKNIKSFYKNIPEVKIKNIITKHFTLYFPNPKKFIKKQGMFNYKKIVLHWDKNYINFIDEVKHLTHIYNITHDKSIFKILQDKKICNIKLLETKNDLLKYLSTEEKY